MQISAQELARIFIEIIPTFFMIICGVRNFVLRFANNLSPNRKRNLTCTEIGMAERAMEGSYKGMLFVDCLMFVNRTVQSFLLDRL